MEGGLIGALPPFDSHADHEQGKRRQEAAEEAHCKRGTRTGRSVAGSNPGFELGIVKFVFCGSLDTSLIYEYSQYIFNNSIMYLKCKILLKENLIKYTS